MILTTDVLEILIFGPLIPCGGLLQLIVLLIPIMLKFPGFIPCVFQPGGFDVDSLAFDWGQENCGLVPPVCFIPRVLMHFLSCRSRGTLVVPFWPSSLFWPYLICEFRGFVVDFFVCLKRC